MKPGNRRRIVRAGAIGLVFAGTLLGWAQNSARENDDVLQNIPSPRQHGLGGVMENDPLYGPKRIQALNADRQKSMVSDTDKLVKLARRLDAEIASNSTGDLTPEELHEVAEIEKLARNVRDKMARSFDVGPKVGTSFTPMAGQNPR